MVIKKDKEQALKFFGYKKTLTTSGSRPRRNRGKRAEE